MTNNERTEATNNERTGESTMSSYDALQALNDLVTLDGETVKSVCDAILEQETDDDDKRKAALLAWLIDNGNKVSLDEISEARYGDNTFSVGRCEYRVLTDDEADEACAEYIKDSLWAFNADFLAGETGIDSDVFKVLSEKCEGANDAILSLVEKTCGLDDFVKSAVSADCRGHFMNTYDGSEDEYGDYYIYRIN
jgi:hypothetical protein